MLFKKTKLKIHISKVHDNDKRSKCEYCEYETSSKRYMTMHMNSVHKSKLKLLDFKNELRPEVQ